MGGLFGGGDSKPTPALQRSPKGVRVIGQFGERALMSGGGTNAAGNLWRQTPQGTQRVGSVGGGQWPPPAGTFGGTEGMG